MKNNDKTKWLVDLVDLGVVSKEFTRMYIENMGPCGDIKWDTTVSSKDSFYGRSAAGELTISDPSEPEKETYISPFSGEAM